MKVCVILGAGPGVGAAVAEAFARQQYHVALCSRSIDKLAALQQKIGHASLHALDVADHEQIEQMLQTIESDIGEIDVVVYNAYSLSPGRCSNLKVAKLDQSLKVNLTGALVAANTAAQFMVKRERGSILITGGGFGLNPEPKFAALSIGKAALRNLVLCLHQELLPKGIHVGTVTICGTVAPDTAFDPSIIAESFIQLHNQATGEFAAEIVFTGETMARQPE